MGPDLGSIQGIHPAMHGENLVGKEVDGKGSKRENRRIESEAQSNDVPVGTIETQDAFHFKAIDFASLAKGVLAFCASFQQPVNQAGCQAQDTGAYGYQERSTPTWRA